MKNTTYVQDCYLPFGSPKHKCHPEWSETDDCEGDAGGAASRSKPTGDGGEGDRGKGGLLI